MVASHGCTYASSPRQAILRLLFFSFLAVPLPTLAVTRAPLSAKGIFGGHFFDDKGNEFSRVVGNIPVYDIIKGERRPRKSADERKSVFRLLHFPCQTLSLESIKHFLQSNARQQCFRSTWNMRRSGVPSSRSLSLSFPICSCAPCFAATIHSVCSLVSAANHFSSSVSFALLSL